MHTQFFQHMQLKHLVIRSVFIPIPKKGNDKDYSSCCIRTVFRSDFVNPQHHPEPDVKSRLSTNMKSQGLT